MKNIFRYPLFVLLGLALILTSCYMPGSSPKSTPMPTMAITPTTSGAAAQPTSVQPVATSIPATNIPAVTDTKSPETQPTAAQAPSTPTAALQPTKPPALGGIPVDAARIQFQPGTTATTVKGNLNGSDKAVYVVEASAGQTMKIQLWSPNADVYIEVVGADGQSLVKVSDKTTQWASVLPSNQNYVLTAIPSGGATSFSMDIAVVGQSAAPTSGPQPTTAPQPTAAPQPTIAPTTAAGQFDPYAILGAPSYTDPMNGSSRPDWVNPDGTMPNTDDIKLAFTDARFYVTGKDAGFNTWWFTWRSLKDFYIEQIVDTADCAGKDAYGLILRGPAHLSGVSYGYVVSFSCDGYFQVYRLDGIKPWTTVALIDWTKNNAINAGSYQRNIVGVMAKGGTFTIYANGVKLADLTDNHYQDGRYGVYVGASSTSFFTYRVERLSYWIIK